MFELDSVGTLMVALGAAGAVYSITYVILIWRGSFDEDDALAEKTDEEGDS